MQLIANTYPDRGAPGHLPLVQATACQVILAAVVRKRASGWGHTATSVMQCVLHYSFKQWSHTLVPVFQRNPQAFR